ncbi:hypothetical protein AB0F81_07815 [Actinoplanes sp. NPDC024001]|uniref:hypothetical protein n=1 Tax=Actinoplanes sp. NPDC024001 TaxID=3154598 RepID=UPI0033CB091A
MRFTNACTALAVLTAGILVIGNPAQASGATATAESAAAKAAKKPLRAERRTDFDAIACGTSIEQGGDSTIITHYHCSGTDLALALTARNSDGSVAFTSECQQFLAGEAWYWEITRSPVFLYRVAGCA